MTSVRLKPEIEKRLVDLALKTHRSKSYYIERALEEFLDDHADYIAAQTSYDDYLKNGKESISIESLENKLALNVQNS